MLVIHGGYLETEVQDRKAGGMAVICSWAGC